MAEVIKEPIKQQKSPFGKPKKADIIVYRLVERNNKLRDDTPPYPPYKRFPNTDIITWNFGTEQNPDWRERAIRYLPGFQSIFVDEQEANGRVIPEQVIANAPRFEIIEGEIKVRPHEHTKIKFLDLCNRNVNSPNRTGRVEAIFEKYSEENVVKQKSDKLKAQREAIILAASASDEQIAFHAKYLDVSLIDPVTQATRTKEAIKADYEEAALGNPEKFTETFNDPDLKMKWLIENALDNNVISLTLIPGKAAWVGSKEEICEMPAGMFPAEALFNFSQTKDGEELAKRLKKEG